MTFDLFDWLNLTKKREITKQEQQSEKKEQPDLFRVESDDISDVRPKTEVLSAIRRSTRKSSIRKMDS